MNTEDMKPKNYDYARGITRDLSLVERLGMIGLFGLNGFVLWVYIPGIFGIAIGGSVLALAGVMFLGELWRQFQIRVLGLDDGNGGDEQS